MSIDKKEQSIVKKLIVSVGAFIIIISTILITLNFYTSRSIAFEEKISHLEKTASIKKAKTEQIFEKSYYEIKTLEDSVKTVMVDDSIVNKREFVENIAKKIVIRDENVIGIGIGFNKNAFDNKDASYVGIEKYGNEGQFIPYITYSNNQINVEPMLDMEEAEYYLAPKNAGKDVLIEPYEYKINNQKVMMTTISIPMYDDNNKFIGILGIDMLLDKIQDDMEITINHQMDAEYYLVSNNGTIVANDLDKTKINESIIRYYPNFDENKVELESNEIISRYSEYYPDLYKVNLTMDFGELNAKWYLLASIDDEVIFAQTYLELIINILISIALTFIGVLILALLIKKIIKPMTILSEEMGKFEIKDVEKLSINLEESEISEVNILIKAYRNIINSLKENYKIRSRKEFLQNAQVSMNVLIQSADTLEKLAKNIIKEVTKQINGQVGALYLANNNKEKTYDLYASYAYIKRKGIDTSYKTGEGLIGQAALENEMIIISEVPEDYIAINSGLGKTVPKNIVIVPYTLNDEVIAVIEIGLVDDIDETVLEYLETIENSVTIALNNMKNNDYNKLLLNQTMEQSIKLQQQQEELRVSNEELEEQTEILKNSQAELETQQEELRAINEELESNAKLMELSKKEIELKNTELEKAQKEIEGKAEDLELSNKYKSEFLANMSHELRTPLNSILILSELLENNPRKTLCEKDIEFAKTINTSGQDLLNLINDILDLSKVEAGKEELEISEVNIEELVNEMKAMFELVAVNKNLDFITEIDKKLPVNIMTDKQKIKQIIKNLLSNAFKFTIKGKVTLRIITNDDKMNIQIIDTGIGIDKNKIENIFEAFKQEDGSVSRKFGGTGLGLSISKEYAKLLGGRIDVKSEKGFGSTFSLIIPFRSKEKWKVLKESSETKEISNNTINEASTLDNSENLSLEASEDIIYVEDDRNDIKENDDVILIVDDDKIFAEVVAKLVKEKNYKTIVAETGESALFLADYYLPTGIIVDIGLPGIDGYQVIKRLKQNKRTKDIPVYIISGKEKNKNQDLKGAVEYYQKPINSNQIEEILENTSVQVSRMKNIMVIEDDDNQRKSLVELINATYEYINIASCISGTEALEKLNNENFDLIILDLGLKDYKGFEFIEVLKNDDKLKNIPIIINTGKEIQKEEELQLRQKVKEIIIKGNESTRRLLDEIKLFIHSAKDKEIVDDNELFLDKTILIVDDDMRNVFALSSILEASGINTEIAINGKEGIEKLKDNKNIDLVLMDIMMPEMNGYEAMNIIRKTEGICDISIIALTAKAMKGDRDKCIKAGANEYLSKPIDREKLLSLLRVWL